MSVTAEFVLFPKNKPEKIKSATGSRFIPFLPSRDITSIVNREARYRRTFDGSGYLFAVLLPFLEEKGIDLFHTDHDAIANIVGKRLDITCFAIGYSERLRYEADLQPEHFTVDEMTRFWNEFNQDSWEDAGEAMLAALKVLHGYICRLDPDTVLLLSCAEISLARLK